MRKAMVCGMWQHGDIEGVRQPLMEGLEEPVFSSRPLRGKNFTVHICETEAKPQEGTTEDATDLMASSLVRTSQHNMPRNSQEVLDVHRRPACQSEILTVLHILTVINGAIAS